MLSHLKCASVSFLIGLSVSACGSKPGDDPLINADQPELTSHLPGLPSNASSFLIGGIKGSGGDAVVCFANKDAQKTVREQLQSNNYPNANVNNPFKDPAISGAISSVELLDVFEFKLPSGFPGVIRGTVDIDTTFDKMAPRLIQRMAQKSRFGDKIAEALMQVPLENWRQAEGVLDINDSAQVFFIPSDCLLIQVAVRVDRQVFYDVNLWQKMDELSRTALVLHEL
ncbi:MAG: hypothetical protein NTV34_04865, partial [Proteobacteria bacterium]|nr:hypothetical protein [Pseudomonadota bacterium]